MFLSCFSACDLKVNKRQVYDKNLKLNLAGSKYNMKTCTFLKTYPNQLEQNWTGWTPLIQSPKGKC